MAGVVAGEDRTPLEDLARVDLEDLLDLEGVRFGCAL